MRVQRLGAAGAWRQVARPVPGCAQSALTRKFFYVFTCEYCLSHYITAVFLAITGYRLLLDDWRGYLVGFFALVGMANAYMSLFGRLRVDIKSERLDIAVKEEVIAADHQPPGAGAA